jgi:hypothetical protein
MRERAIAQLEGKASLADDLADAMAKLKRSGIDVDEPVLAAVRSVG